MIPQLWELLNYSLSSLGVNIIWSYQTAARTAKPYLVVNYTNADVPDFDFYGQVDENGISKIASWRKAVVDLQFYCNDDSYRLASRSALLLATESSLTKQVQLDVSLGTRLMLQRVPALLNESQYEDRAIYQFDFYYTESVDDDVGLIETVIVDGEYTGSLTDIHCHEIISIDDNLVQWDTEGIYGWDDNTTVWGDQHDQ